MLPDQHIRSKLQDKIVGIAGCGGLGSNCAVALARVGIGRLIVADFDVIEPSNLNRQYFFRDQAGMSKAMALKDVIGKIDAAILVEAHHAVLTPENVPGIFSGCDVIVEAFDRAEMKQMLIESCSTAMPDVPLVCGVGLAGWGGNGLIGTWRSGNIYICGDRTIEVSPDCPPLAPRVGIVACMQANQVLEILLGKMK